MSGSFKAKHAIKPGELICNIAEHEAVMTIVVGTRGLGRIRRIMSGSVSHYVVHHAHCLVIVCRK